MSVVDNFNRLIPAKEVGLPQAEEINIGTWAVRYDDEDELLVTDATSLEDAIDKMKQEFLESIGDDERTIIVYREVKRVTLKLDARVVE